DQRSDRILPVELNTEDRTGRSSNLVAASDSSLSSEILLPQTPPEFPQLATANTSPLVNEATDVSPENIVKEATDVSSENIEVSGRDGVQPHGTELSRRSPKILPMLNRNKRTLPPQLEEKREESNNIEALIKMKTKPRRRMVEFLPGPVTKTATVLVPRVELHEAVASKFAPDYPDFDANKMLQAVLTGDYSRFRAATEFFVSRDGQEILDEISS
ncbi:hypothetical protein OESDEN_25016, partial [Oesophagostomum dentatum]